MQVVGDLARWRGWTTTEVPLRATCTRNTWHE